MTKNNVDSIKTLSQRVIKDLLAQGKTSANYHVTIRIDQDSPDVLKVFGAFSPDERSVIIEQVFDTLQDRIADVIGAKCSFKKAALQREIAKKFMKVERQKSRKLRQRKERRQQTKKQSAGKPSD